MLGFDLDKRQNIARAGGSRFSLYYPRQLHLLRQAATLEAHGVGAKMRLLQLFRALTPHDDGGGIVRRWSENFTRPEEEGWTKLAAKQGEELGRLGKEDRWSSEADLEQLIPEELRYSLDDVVKPILDAHRKERGGVPAGTSGKGETEPTTPTKTLPDDPPTPPYTPVLEVLADIMQRRCEEEQAKVRGWKPRAEELELGSLSHTLTPYPFG